MFSIDKRTLAEQVATNLRSRILKLDFKPGERIIVDTLAGDLQVSRTPIREGLKELAAEGLVRYDGNTYSVTSFSEDDIVELFQIRTVLEALSAQLAARFISEEGLRELERSLEEGRRYLADRDTESLITLDMRFHEIIDGSSRNRRLLALLNIYRLQTWYVRRALFIASYHEYVETKTLEEHVDILEQLRRHDSAGAFAAMERHLRGGEQRTLAVFRRA